MLQGKWVWQNYFGSSEEAIRAEYAFGRQLATGLQHDLSFCADADKQQSVNEIGAQLVLRVRKKERRFEFQLFNSSSINALALPGGFIFASTALYDLCRSQKDELAFIFAHEMIHVVQGHALKRLIANRSLDLILRSIQTSSPLGGLTKSAVGELLEKGYSRENELEADKYGLQLAVSAGFDGDAAVQALRRIAQRPSSEDFFSYFSTHPSLTERIEQLNHLTTRG